MITVPSVGAHREAARASAVLRRPREVPAVRGSRRRRRRRRWPHRTWPRQPRWHRHRRRPPQTPEPKPRAVQQEVKMSERLEEINKKKLYKKNSRTSLKL